MLPATRAPWALAVLLFVVVLAVFFPALSNGYVWDDRIYFHAHPTDVYFASWLEHGREPFAIAANYFRPVAMLGLLADFAAGPGPRASHLINLLIHALNAALVSGLAWRLLRLRGGAAAPWTAFVAGLWYGLHPALIEPAAMVMCRFDLMAATFSLLLLHASLATGRWVLPAICGLFLAALLSKEGAAGLLVAWPFWVVAVAALGGSFERRTIVPRLVQGWAALGAGLALDLILRFWARGYVWVFGDPALAAGAHVELVAMSVAQQVRLMLLPFGGVDPFHTVASFSAVSYLVAAAAVAAAGFCATRSALRPWAALAFAGFAALAPTSNVIPIPFAGGVYTADRYQTLPLVFLAPVVAAALQWAALQPASMRRLALAPLLAWLVGALVLIRSTLPLMHDEVRFWSWVTRLHPEALVAQGNLADALLREERLAEALRVLTPALEKGADSAALWHNLARTQRGLGQLAAARQAADRAIALDPDNVHFWHTRATLDANAGDLAGAERLIRERVLARDPGLVEAHLNLIRLLVATRRSAEAEAWVGSHGEVLVGAWREQALALIVPGSDGAPR